MFFVIWSFEHRAWWGPGGSGYVADLSNAGRYTASEAGSIVTDSVWNDEVAVLFNIAAQKGPPKFHPYAGDDPNYHGG
jgi:hypothetical protein